MKRLSSSAAVKAIAAAGGGGDEQQLASSVAALQCKEAPLKAMLATANKREARTGLVDAGLGKILANFIVKEPAGSSTRLLSMEILVVLLNGDDQVVNGKRSELQLRLFPVVVDAALLAVQDEAPGSLSKQAALEICRRLARNFANKFPLYNKGILPFAMATATKETGGSSDKAWLIILTLATDAKAGVSMMHRQDFCFQLVACLSKPASLANAVRVVQNLAQHPDCQPLLLAAGVFEPLTLILESEKEDQDLQMQSIMALANLVGKDELKSSCLRSSSTGLVKIVSLLARVVADDNRAHAHWTLGMLLAPLHNCLVIEANRLVVGESLVELLPRVLVLSDAALAVEGVVPSYDAELALRCLLHLSFDPVLRDGMRKDNGLLASIHKSVAHGNTDAEWRQAARAADALKFRLTDERANGTTPGAAPVLPPSARSPQVMISYSWKNQRTALQLATLARQVGLKVWIDLEKMGNEVMESMAQAVQGSNCLFVLISDSYKLSAACKCEAMFAFELKRKTIPLLAEPNYVADGWLGALVAGKLRFDVSSDDLMLESFPKIVVEAGGSSQVNNNQSAGFSSGNAISTVQDVATWLEKEGFPASVRDKFLAASIDGPALQTLASNFSLYFNDLGELGIDSISLKLRLQSRLRSAYR